MTGYAFGDTDLAAERLRVLDRVFAPTTDGLLADVDAHGGARARVADLGCGPGATTARLVTRYPTADVTGVDASEAFLRHARAAAPTAHFVQHDVTRPLPGAPYDLVYARFLLAHLPDVGAAIDGWVGALASGGVLVLEETEHIASTDPWFGRYEELSAARVRASGADVYAGAAIPGALPVAMTELVIDRVVVLDLSAGQAAALFWRNLATWGDDVVADGLVSARDCAALLDHLRGRVDDQTRGCFEWTHHQTALRAA